MAPVKEKKSEKAYIHCFQLIKFITVHSIIFLTFNYKKLLNNSLIVVILGILPGSCFGFNSKLSFSHNALKQNHTEPGGIGNAYTVNKKIIEKESFNSVFGT